MKKEIQRIEELISAVEDEHQRLRQLKKLDFLRLKIQNIRQRPLNLEEYEIYHRKVVEKISVSDLFGKEKKSGKAG
ncbi:MAG: hypothetical protein KKE17_12670 [Proteobacteria bacterium]|nr:hypothetical protein [Pseudomonadota bacterium]